MDDLRKQIGEIDRELLKLIEKRTSLAKEIGEYKREHHLPIRNREVENKVFEGFHGVPQEIPESLIRISCEAQESVPKKMVHIIGREGKMGQWFARFLGGGQVPLEEADLIIVSTPINVTAEILLSLIPKNPSGLIFDICSMKNPILPAFKECVEAGLKITSLHPMYGPVVPSLFNTKILFCSHPGTETALSEAKELFVQTSADLITLPIEEHDHFFSYTSGLTHLHHLVFGKVLERSGKSIEELEKMGSVSFHKQIALTKRILKASPEMVFSILGEGKKALQDYLGVMEDETAFAAFMKETRDYFFGDSES